ncbi:DUF4435 domain-containing protein [Flavobacterium sp. H4147]|uniref:DUF4435 domain-containing protein n=1 Tax=Flavobacterium sp. H4147 TaxID=3034149 RepID=UPI0023EC684D|nr:DUF4435 domain-containing protein [Flavobacterium sp. H4147]
MNLLDTLDLAITRPVASQIKVLTQYKKTDSTIFCLVEGQEDISFYRNYIERYFPNNIKYIICNGKGNVIDNYKNLNWNFYDKKRILFFIDKDFDNYINEEILTDENIFTTEYYSIENYLVDEIVLSKFISDNCHIHDETIIKELIHDFHLKHADFTKHLTKISAWMIYCRKNKFRVNFNDINLSDLFQIDKDGKFIKIKLDDFENHFDYICNKTNTKHFDLREIKTIYEELISETNKKKFLRGKYELFFMFLFIKYIVDQIVPKLSLKVKELNKVNNEKFSKPKVTIQVREENIFQVLCNKVKEPDSLKNFINTIK